jgi:hypothetical protein
VAQRSGEKNSDIETSFTPAACRWWTHSLKIFPPRRLPPWETFSIAPAQPLTPSWQKGLGGVSTHHHDVMMSPWWLRGTSPNHPISVFVQNSARRGDAKSTIHQLRRPTACYIMLPRFFCISRHVGPSKKGQRKFLSTIWPLQSAVQENVDLTSGGISMMWHDVTMCIYPLVN